MNFFNIFGIMLISIIGLGINNTYAEIDPLSELIFFQTGELQTENDDFFISDTFDIREFSNGKIIRVSGQTLEGFPYITYSKITNEQLDTFGTIFIRGEFVKLSFVEKESIVEDVETENNDLTIVAQYTQRAHSKQVVFIDVKVFENEQNKYIGFNQNYGHVSNTNVHVKITNEENKEVFSSNGITNDKGLFETEYLIPDNSKIETLTVSINTENNNSYSSKILQIFILGNLANNG